MTQTQHSLRYAGSAIAAALAFASTAGLAQDAAAPFQPAPEPVIVVPDIPVPAAPEPTVVLPSTQPETVQPVPQPSAEAPLPQPSASTTAARTRAEPAARTAPEPAPRAVAPAPATVEQSAPVPAAPIVEPVAAAPAPSAVTAAQTPAPADDNTGILALILGGLAFLALAIWGFIAIGRRKSVRRYVAEDLAPPMPVAPKPVMVEPAPVAEREPLIEAPRTVSPINAPSFASRSAPVSGALPHAGASVALPARVPEDFAERDALMRRMIAARPDRANPFTDRGARTKRARLMLQSLGRDFGESEPWIDLSQYPNNWPEFARKRSVAA